MAPRCETELESTCLQRNRTPPIPESSLWPRIRIESSGLPNSYQNAPVKLRIMAVAGPSRARSENGARKLARGDGGVEIGLAVLVVGVAVVSVALYV